MPTYLVTLSSGAGVYQAMIKDPENRENVTRERIERLGGDLKGYYFGNGNKIYMIADFTDSASLYTVILPVFATGGAVEMDVVEIMGTQAMTEICAEIPSKFGDYAPKL